MCSYYIFIHLDINLFLPLPLPLLLTLFLLLLLLLLYLCCMQVVQVPTNRPSLRMDRAPILFFNVKAKERYLFNTVGTGARHTCTWTVMVG